MTHIKYKSFGSIKENSSRTHDGHEAMAQASTGLWPVEIEMFRCILSPIYISTLFLYISRTTPFEKLITTFVTFTTNSSFAVVYDSILLYLK